MEKHSVQSDAPKLRATGLPVYLLERDRHVVQMVKFILAHGTDLSSETAHALLTMAAKPRN
jgi:hypothetical protein